MLKAVCISLLSFSLASPLWAVDKVSLNYDWKPGIYVKVKGYQLKEKFLEGKPQESVKMNTSYIMSTKIHEQGLQVDFMDVVASVESDNDQIQGWMKTYIETITESIPSYIIDDQGALVGAVNVPKFRDAVISSIDKILIELSDEQRQQMMAGLSQIFTEDALNAQLAGEWSLYVAQWIGADLEDDGVYQLEFDSPVPFLGNQPVKTHAEYEFAGRVDCDELDKSQNCVVLVYRTETDGISMKELMEKLLPEGAVVPDIDISLTLDLEIVLDPNTLLTYYVKSVKHASTPVEGAQGPVAATQVETSEYEYLYVMGNK